MTAPTPTFDTLPLSPATLSNLTQLGYTAMTPIQAASLPLTLSVGTEAPAKLSLKARLPSLRGTPRSTFEYTLTVGNDSGKDLTVALAAAPYAFSRRRLRCWDP